MYVCDVILWVNGMGSIECEIMTLGKFKKKTDEAI